ncbi:related to DUF1295 domain [Lecanosticta acicola]|uniref:Related to DUF1295 domain n=1 Tax=Lecanosticta acicola TaxID=111012 RepID=A0AAI8YUF3_9PEZI|nr:related to DUF1295 domain [Lecanosticta acicola]
MPLMAATDMAVPAVKTLLECADYDRTFAQYLPQLYELPNQILTSITDPEALKQLYISTNPAISGLAFAIATIPIFLIVSEINKNYSQVDRVWSIMPTVFNVHYALWARMNGLPTAKIDNVLAFSVVWSIRLTFNYWRKGGYQIGSEDYRWELIKKQIGSAGYMLLNVLFVASIQPVLLWAVTLPAYVLLLTSRIQPEMATVDLIFSRSLIALVVFEYFADGQMWNYQQAKKEYQKTAKVPDGWTRAQMDRGFVTTGLWKYSRHPNFAAEQAIWVLLYLWSCVDTNQYWNWTFVGVLGYVGVFSGSTPLTEWISGSKYPEYRMYQARVGMFLPSLLGSYWDEEEMVRVAPQAPAATKKAGKSS